jgi:hypothetical protein
MRTTVNSPFVLLRAFLAELFISFIRTNKEQLGIVEANLTKPQLMVSGPGFPEKPCDLDSSYPRDVRYGRNW